jgi:hypothetical protein
VSSGCRGNDGGKCYSKFHEILSTAQCTAAGSTALTRARWSVLNIARIAKELNVEPWKLLKDEWCNYGPERADIRAAGCQLVAKQPVPDRCSKMIFGKPL